MYNSLSNSNTIVIINQSQIHINQSHLHDTFLFILNQLKLNSISTSLVNHLFSSRVKTMQPANSIYIEYLTLNVNVLKKIIQFYLNRLKHFNDHEDEISVFAFIIQEVWYEFLSRNNFSNVIGVGCDGVISEISKTFGVQVFEVAHGIPNVESQDPKYLFSGAIPTYYLLWSTAYSRKDNSSLRWLLSIGYPNQDVLTSHLPQKDDVVLFGLTYDTKFEIDPWGMLTKETDKAIKLLLSENFRVAIRLHPMSIQNIGIGRRRKPKFSTIEEYLLQRYPKLDSISDPFSVSLYSDIDKSSVIISSGSLALNAIYRGKVAVVFDAPELVPYVPNLFWQNQCIIKISFENLHLLPKTIKEARCFAPPKTNNSDEFISYLVESRLRVLPSAE